MKPLPHSAPTHHRMWRDFLRHGVLSSAAGAVIALAWLAMGGRSLLATMVYSQSIAIACWIFIDGSRLLLARYLYRGTPGHPYATAGFPGWGGMFACLLLGTTAGVVLGTTVARGLLGGSAGPAAGFSSSLSIATLLVSLLPGSAITYVAYSRERLRQTQLEVELARRQAAEHHLRLLESQLEPHMLFNTLATLRALIDSDAPRARSMLDHLIDYLRATLGASRAPTLTLAAEFARTADYLALMKIRMGDRLRVVIDLPPALVDESVPALLLQPLVENAVRHALEPNIAGGLLHVSAASEGDDLVLRVRDTGVGVRSAAIGGTEAPAGFGLRQVTERIETAYAGAARFTLAAATDDRGGSVATLRLPRMGTRP